MQLAMAELSIMESRVAEQYCRGLNDTEVADSLGIMPWTCKTHKKHIFRKWGINNTHEMVLLYLAKMKDKDAEIADIRNKGVSIFLLLLVIFQISFIETDYARNINNVRIARSGRSGRARKNNNDDTIEFGYIG